VQEPASSSLEALNFFAGVGTEDDEPPTSLRRLFSLYNIPIRSFASLATPATSDWASRATAVTVEEGALHKQGAWIQVGKYLALPAEAEPQATVTPFSYRSSFSLLATTSYQVSDILCRSSRRASGYFASSGSRSPTAFVQGYLPAATSPEIPRLPRSSTSLFATKSSSESL